MKLSYPKYRIKSIQDSFLVLYKKDKYSPWYCIDNKTNDYWSIPEHIEKYCLLDTELEAEQVIIQHQNKPLSFNEALSKIFNEVKKDD